jgi:hypothetical protein
MFKKAITAKYKANKIISRRDVKSKAINGNIYVNKKSVINVVDLRADTIIAEPLLSSGFFLFIVKQMINTALDMTITSIITANTISTKCSSKKQRNEEYCTGKVL